jgi:hypothetical protein
VSESPKIEALNPATGEVIYTFASMRTVADAGYRKSSVQDCLDGWHYEYANMLWRRSGEPVPQPPADPPEIRVTGNLVATFAGECVYSAPGSLLQFGDFYRRFIEWLPDDEKENWSRIRISRSLPPTCAAGTGGKNITYLINAAWEARPAGQPYKIVGGKIKRAA